MGSCDNNIITIQEQAIKAINGDEEALNKIINHYMPYIIKHIETNYKEFICDKENLIQSGIAGINDCLNYWKNNTSKFFCTFVKSFIRNSIRKYINKPKKNITDWTKEMLEGNLTSRDKIVNYYIKYIKQVIETEYDNSKCDKEDLLQAGLLGVVTAINKYNNNCNVPFTTYVHRYIQRSINKEIKNQQKNSNINYNGLHNIFEEHINIDFFDDFENIELINQCIEKLPERTKEILCFHIYRKLPFREIGKIYSISNQRVTQIYKGAIIKIKDEINNNNKILIKKKSN